jgi:hypothetical protein
MNAKHAISTLLAAGMVLTQGLLGQTAPKGFVAHEWGTFTSFQGSDGVPLKWSNPFATAKLPQFVYDWKKPGLGRQTTSPLFAGVFSKGEVVTLQRMETPVIYFYSDRERSVDVTVRFPQGLMTEWYPQTTTLGPSVAPPPASVRSLDSLLHRAGISRNFSTASILGDNSVKDNLIAWKGVRVRPTVPDTEVASLLPKDATGNHYLTARETDAAILKVVTTNQTAEYEKFLFYRGVANFVAPLKVSMPGDDVLVILNAGKEPLEHLFVMKLEQGQGRLIHLERIGAGEQKSLTLGGEGIALTPEGMSEQLKKQMVEALVGQGLYPREATAMVNTWKDSWFDEEGTRVLYIMPRAWTDATLPMKLSPAPDELVRVMVARAEVLSPKVERILVSENSAANGNASFNAGMFKQLGRFGSAALEHVRAKAAPSQ